MSKWLLTESDELLNLAHVIKFYISEKTYSIYAIIDQKNEDGRNVSVKVYAANKDNVDTKAMTDEDKEKYKKLCDSRLIGIINFIEHCTEEGVCGNLCLIDEIHDDGIYGGF